MKFHLKKIPIFICQLVLCALMCAAPAFAAFTPPFEPDAAAVYVINLDTGVLVYEKNADEPRDIASLTKLMTCLLLLENEADLDTVVTAPGYVFDELFGQGGSTADIRPYEQVSCRNLLYAMLLPSANEAANITADHIGGGNMEAFFSMMNSRAAQLGCTNTNFTNAHGLFGKEAGNYSTAHDLALIAQACWKNDVFREAAQTNVHWMPLSNKHTVVEVSGGPEGMAYPIRTTNRMQEKSSGVYRSYIQGIKTGSTIEAGRNFVSTATQNGTTYLAVVLGSPWEPAEDGYSVAFHVTANLYDWIFSSFQVAPALDTEKPLQEVDVKYCSEKDTLAVYPASDFMTLLPTESDDSVVQKTYRLPETVAAPIRAGDVIGTVTLTMAGEELGTVKLISKSDLERNDFMYFLDKAQSFLTSRFFFFIVLLAAAAVIAYIAFIRALHHKDEKRRKIRRRRM
ncbi:MAG: D-alanyl-D-alanine carboxypeptidase family protein [Oscillospiraceae bacterium]|nr:D-alanyl-D-alanine carboxypeptidase family protein [Oscillospiraceae bacterium]